MSKLFSIINSNKINHCKEINEVIHPESTGKSMLTNCDFSHSEEKFNKMMEEIERERNKNKKGGLYNDDLFRSK